MIQSIRLIWLLVIFVWACTVLEFQVVEAEQRESPSIIHKMHSEDGTLDEEITVKMNKNDLPVNENVRCNYYNLFKEMGVMTETGELNTDNIYPLLNIDNDQFAKDFDKYAKKCMKIRGIDRCDTAWKISKCMFRSEDIKKSSKKYTKKHV